MLRRAPDGTYETLVRDNRIAWPDTLAMGCDGYLYLTANGFHLQARFHAGQDRRQPPYLVCRLRVEASPVLLR